MSIAQVRDNPKAEKAFLDYVNMGEDRSLAALAEEYQRRTKGVPTRQLSKLKEWSAAYGWKRRIAQAHAEEAEEKLHEAAILDADTYHRSSQILNERMHYATPGHTDVVIKIRESVRKPIQKAGASLDVSGGALTIVISEREDGPT